MKRRTKQQDSKQRRERRAFMHRCKPQLKLRRLLRAKQYSSMRSTVVMAQMCGVALGTYKRWRLGTALPRPRFVGNIARVLDTTPDQIAQVLVHDELVIDQTALGSTDSQPSSKTQSRQRSGQSRVAPKQQSRAAATS